MGKRGGGLGTGNGWGRLFGWSTFLEMFFSLLVMVVLKIIPMDMYSFYVGNIFVIQYKTT